MNKKVLHLVNGEFYAGAERVQDLLAKCLPAYGYDVGFVCLKPKLFPKSRQTVGAPLLEAPMSSSFDIRVARKVADLTKTGQYDLLHSHTPRAVLIGSLASKMTGLPLVHHVHSPTGRDTENPLRNRVNAFVENICMRQARRLIAVSQSLGTHLRKSGFADSKIAVVPNGVPVLKPNSDWLAPAQGDWVLGMVALIRPRKGIEILLQALALLRKQGLPVRLRAVGSFETVEYERQVKALADNLGVSAFIDWVGFTRDVASELSRMHIFVLPSLFGEGLPMVMIEAMAAGLPVIGTQVEGIPEVLKPGNAGLVVSPNDSGALAEGIGKIIAMGAGAKTLADAGHARQRDFYSDTAMAKGVAEVYRSIGI